MTWLMSQTAGRSGAPREHASAVAEDDLLADPVGDLVRRGRQIGVEVDDGLDGDLGAGVARTSRWTWSRSTRRWPSSIRPVGPNTVDSSSREASKWAWRTTSRAAGRRWGSALAPARSRAVWVRARSPRAAERRAWSDSSDPSAFRTCRAVGERAVEVESVGDVELGLEPHRAGEVDVVVVDGGVARVDVEVAVLRIRGRIDVGEVVALDRLGDEPVELRRTDATGDGGDLRVDERRGLPGQRGSGVDGDLATRRARHAGTVRRGPAPTDAGAGGAARGRGRRASSPRSSRCPGRCRARRGRTPPPAAHPRPRWAPRAHDRGDREGGGVVDRLGRVQVSPPRGCHEEICRGSLLSRLLLPGEREQVEKR